MKTVLNRFYEAGPEFSNRILSILSPGQDQSYPGPGPGPRPDFNNALNNSTFREHLNSKSTENLFSRLRHT